MAVTCKGVGRLHSGRMHAPSAPSVLLTIERLGAAHKKTTSQPRGEGTRRSIDRSIRQLKRAPFIPAERGSSHRARTATNLYHRCSPPSLPRGRAPNAAAVLPRAFSLAPLVGAAGACFWGGTVINDRALFAFIVDHGRIDSRSSICRFFASQFSSRSCL